MVVAARPFNGQTASTHKIRAFGGRGRYKKTMNDHTGSANAMPSRWTARGTVDGATAMPSFALLTLCKLVTHKNRLCA